MDLHPEGVPGAVTSVPSEQISDLLVAPFANAGATRPNAASGFFERSYMIKLAPLQALQGADHLLPLPGVLPLWREDPRLLSVSPPGLRR